MDSVEAEPLFDELFVQGLQNPDVHRKGMRRRGHRSSDRQDRGSQQEQRAAFRWRTSLMPTMPASGATTRRSSGWSARSRPGLPARGGGSRQGRRCLARDVGRMAASQPRSASTPARPSRTRTWNGSRWKIPRARAVISDLPRCVAGQPLPCVRIGGLPDSVRGVWSLWEISLSRRWLQPQALPAGVRHRRRSHLCADREAHLGSAAD